jgi:hypothetical protein
MGKPWILLSSKVIKAIPPFYPPSVPGMLFFPNEVTKRVLMPGPPNVIEVLSLSSVSTTMTTSPVAGSILAIFPVPHKLYQRYPWVSTVPPSKAPFSAHYLSHFLTILAGPLTVEVSGS